MGRQQTEKPVPRILASVGPDTPSRGCSGEAGWSRLPSVKAITRRSWFLALGAYAGARRPLAAAPPATRLWNGRDFTGWQRAGRGVWTIEDRALVGRYDHDKPGPGYLLTAAEYQDFRLSLEFWVSKGGNSGVFVREPNRTWGHRGDDRPAHGNRRGYEVQVDYNDPKNPTGSIYNLGRATKLAGGEERWNRMEIECLGPRVKVWIDGELVNDFSPAKAQKGVIGLQIHGGKPHHHVIKYRDLELKDLSKQ